MKVLLAAWMFNVDIAALIYCIIRLNLSFFLRNRTQGFLLHVHGTHAESPWLFMGHNVLPSSILTPQPCHNHFHPIPPGAAEAELILPKLGKSKLFLGSLRRTSFAVEGGGGEGSFFPSLFLLSSLLILSLSLSFAPQSQSSLII